MAEQSERTGYEIAIVGMAARVPGADDVAAFWRNLRDGVESIRFFTREELLEDGADPRVIDHPDYVPARGYLAGADTFDAALFGFTPRDAEVTDPQHRVLLECAWAALEHAGYDPARAGRAIGVFAGSGGSVYVRSVEAAAERIAAVGSLRASLWNDKDQLAAGISYRLNLQGPSLSIQTACSTSLVAVHLACQSLLAGESDLALAGGVSIPGVLRRGHLYSPDGIVSPDGHCRAFDAEARGTVGGSGAGLVVLKRLEDAIADGDTIHAVIRGSAINNDGAEKVGYTAPSLIGQARVISEALAAAGVDPATVQYVETHGSGTPLGDGIELKALGEVLSRADGRARWAIGSVKTNVGHLDSAAGVTGLIKTVLALEHGEIPPSLNCAVPNPEVEASGGGRIVVNTGLREWTRNGTPRRAGVSSFGIGGTNAHVVLEEAPPREPSGPSRALQLLVLSARTTTALAKAAETLADRLETEAPPLADAAFTLQTGRRELEHRLAVVCADAAEGAALLRKGAGAGVVPVPRGERPVAFMFPGVGTHYVNMGRGLYDAEPVYRAAVDECCELLRPVLGSDLREVLFSAVAEEGKGGGWDLRRLLGRESADPAEAAPLDDTRFAQPAVFVTEYALAKLWMSWGITPRALIGHSLGEYVAACIAGVLRLEDALRLVALRAKLIDALPAGAMLAIPLGEATLREILPATLDVAAVNTPESCVVAGPAEEIEAFEAVLRERGTVSRRLPARHAFHSRAMARVAAELEGLIAGFTLRAPQVPFVSNVTGTWITDEEARSPGYWARHLCQTVRFSDGVATLRSEPGWVLLEVGPGQALGAWALQHPAGGAPGSHAAFSSLRHQHNRTPDPRFVLETLGALWAAGVAVDWTAFSRGERRHRIPLPGYPFERKRYWVDAPRPPAAPELPHPSEKPADHAAAAAWTDTKGPYVMENRVAARERATAPSRHDAVLAMLKGIVAELTGIGQEHVQTDADFFQAGLDSLLLLQAIAAIEKRVGIRISLVELLEEIATLDALAAHLDRTLPADAVLSGIAPAAAEAEPEPAPRETPSAAPRLVPAPPAFFPPPSAKPLIAEGGESLVERLFAQQLAAMNQLMGQQIAALTGHAAPAPAASNGSHPSPAPAVASEAPAASNGTAASASNGASPLAIPQSPRAKIQPPTFVAYQPLNTEAPAGMTAEQREYLDGFMARFIERTKGSKAHQARYHVPLADTRVTARFRRAWKEITYPIVGKRALGSRVWDVDGNEYVDTGMSFGCNLFGHAPEFVTRAMREQIEAGYGLGPQSEDAGRAAELICQLGGNERAVFCNSGTEAVLGAIRAARAYTGRTKIAYFAGSYHGWSDIVLGRLFANGDRREVRPSAPGVPPLPLGDVLMLDFDEPSSLELLAKHVHEIALVMVEPVQSRRPDLQPFAFLRELRRMTREAGALLLFDELITGFRMGPGGAQAFFGIDADLVTYGKIVAGGLPMGVVAGKTEPMSVFDGGVWRYGDDSYPPAQRTLFAGAFWKHPLSMAVACAVLGEIQRQGRPMYDRLNDKTTRLVQRMNAFFEAGGYPVTAAHFASCFRFFFGPEIKFPDLFSHHLAMEGVYTIPETGTHFLSAAHTDEDLDHVFRAVQASAEAMRGGGFIPGGPTGGARETGVVRIEARPAACGAVGCEACGICASLPSAVLAPSAHGKAEIRRVPLTEGQRQLWIESQMGEAASLAYVESSAIRLHGALDADALHRALQALVDRHDALRITITPDGESQLIHPAQPVDLPREDLRAVPEDEREAEVEAWTRRFVRRPFDLVRGPLVRFALAAVRDDEHVLLFDAHHAALDGWSFGVLWKELDALYAAERDGRPATLPPRPDHASLVRAQIAAVEADPAAQAYWQAQFADGVPVLELPTDRPRPPVRSYRGESVQRKLAPGLAGRLAAAMRPRGLTPYHALLSAFALWLSRLSGQDDVVVGTPAAGQAAGGEAAKLVGYAINVLPIRVRVDPSDTFVEHARRVRRATMTGLQHQAFSLPRLVETLLRTRDAGRPPLFSVLINLDRERGEASLGGVRAEVEPVFGGGAKLDLDLNLVESGDDLRLTCDYATDLFDGETIERWLDALAQVLEQVARDPALPLREVALVDDDERRRVVEEWNQTDAPFPSDRCIHHLVAEQAERTPDAPAVVHRDGEMTYAELDARANRLARHLARRGVAAETRVGICLERGPDLIVALLAVLKAGGAYVAVDPEYPVERLRWTLSDSRASLLVTRARLRDLAGVAEEVRIVDLDAAAAEIAAEPAEAVDGAAGPASLAYVVYTSGSTGTPKGVGIEHRSLANAVLYSGRAYGLGPGERMLQFHSIGFDPATEEIFAALVLGAAVVLRAESRVGAPHEFWDECRRGGVTAAEFPTAVWNHLIPEGGPGGLPEALRMVVVGGESVLPDRIAAWRRAAGDRVRLMISYGPTETTIGMTLWDVDAGEDAPGRPAPLGVPLANSRCYVLDTAGQPLPPGVPGEVYISGVQVARGFLGRPALTAERFLPDPFGPVPGARLYRSGDRAVWRELPADARPRIEGLPYAPRAVLGFRGRVDDQVKVRGFRVEPGEIEAALRDHPSVREAAVVAREEAPGERRLAAYVVAAGEADAEALRAHLRRGLPEHMVPAAFVFLDALPLTTHGKVDRRALPAPEYAARGDYAAPGTPVEERLAEVWREVLAVERVGRHDGFFELGGHSLLLVRLAARLREALGRDVSAVDLLRFPTVAALAEHLEADASAPKPGAGSERAARRRGLAAAREADAALAGADR